jgi:hypothetical protein
VRERNMRRKGKRGREEKGEGILLWKLSFSSFLWAEQDMASEEAGE